MKVDDVTPTVTHHADAWDVELLSATFTTHVFPRHTHDHHVIGLTVSGVEGFSYNGCTHTAPSGTIVLVNPGDVHTGYAVGSMAWVYKGLYPSAEMMAELSGGPQVAFRNCVVDDADLAQRIARAYESLAHTNDNFLATCELFEALRLLCERYAAPTHPVPQRRVATRQVDIARQILLDEASLRLSLRELARRVELSPFHLLRTFADVYGLPPHLFQLQHRVNVTKALLRKTSASLAEIALEAGFADQSHMTNWFKRFVGVTPSRYRRDSRIVCGGPDVHVATPPPAGTARPQ